MYIKAREGLLCYAAMSYSGVFCKNNNDNNKIKKMKKREREDESYNHKNCSDVIKKSEKIILQFRVFILLHCSKEIDILNSNSSLLSFLLYFFFFLSLNMSYLEILVFLLNSFMFPSNGEYVYVIGPIHTSRAV